MSYRQMLCAKLFAVFALLYVCLYSIWFFTGKQNYTFPNISYPGAIYSKIAKHQNHSLDTVNISFKFIFTGEISSNRTLFSTAIGSKGIRLGFLKGNEPWALMIGDKKEPKGFSVTVFPKPSFDTEHTFNAIISKKDAQIFIDGALVAQQFLPNIDYQIDNIIFGTEVAEPSSLTGNINDFRISVKHYSPFIFGALFLFLPSVLLVFLLGFFSGYFSISHKQIIVYGLEIAIITVFCFVYYMHIFGVLFNWGNIIQLIAVLASILFTILIGWVYKKPLLSIKILLAFFLIFILAYPLLELYYVFLFVFVLMTLLLGVLVGETLKCSTAMEKILLGVILAVLLSYIIGYQLFGFFQVILFVYVIISLVVWTLKRLPHKIYKTVNVVLSCICSGIIFCISIVSQYCYKMGGNGLNSDEMNAVFQTNFYEALEFCRSVFSLTDIFIAVFLTLLGGFLTYSIIKKSKEEENLIINLILSLLLIILFAFSYNPISGLYDQISEARNNYEHIAKEYHYYQELRRQHPPKASKLQKGELHILLLGEASNPMHWSAYNYFRNTTPFASKLRDGSNALFFDYAYASFVHTVPSLIKALTAANQYNKGNGFSSPSIIEEANAAGFNTYWLSNQDKVSLVDNPLTILAEGADTVQFTNQSRFKGDGSLLPIFDKTLENLDLSKNNLIIIHLMGSHAEYTKRYPKSFNRNFPSAEEDIGGYYHNKEFVNKILNPYDTSIAYTDAILEEIFKRVDKVNAPVKSMIYVSDHGEDVFNQKFHNASSFTFDMARIPMFIWFSDGYKKQYSFIWKNLSKRTKNIFTLDNLFNSLMSIWGINTPDNDKEYDITSSDYSINLNNALTMYPDDTLQKDLYPASTVHKIAEDPILIKRNNLTALQKMFPEKEFLANYADALGTFIYSIKDGFRGAEINVTAPGLQIGHAPQVVYQRTLGELLALTKFKEGFLWLDIKELKGNQVDEVLAKLEELNKEYSLKNRVLLESKLISENMKKFALSGWKTSFYIFPEWPFAPLEMLAPKIETNSLNSQEDKILKDIAKEINRIIYSQNSTDISFNAKFYPFIKKYLEPLLSKNIKYNTFGMNLPELSNTYFIKESQNNKVLKDKRIHFVLLDPLTPVKIYF